jgi:hypothetical protein
MVCDYDNIILFQNLTHIYVDQADPTKSRLQRFVVEHRSLHARVLAIATRTVTSAAILTRILVVSMAVGSTATTPSTLLMRLPFPRSLVRHSRIQWRTFSFCRFRYWCVGWVFSSAIPYWWALTIRNLSCYRGELDIVNRHHGMRGVCWLGTDNRGTL